MSRFGHNDVTTMSLYNKTKRRLLFAYAHNNLRKFFDFVLDSTSMTPNGLTATPEPTPGTAGESKPDHRSSDDRSPKQTKAPPLGPDT